MKRTALAIFFWVLPAVALAGRNISGVYSLPAGNPVVTGTKITTTWANSTLGDLGTELTNSLSRDGYGGMRQPLQCTDGNAGGPSITFGNETTTGFYRIGASDVGLSVGGTKRWEHTAAGQIETGWVQVAGTVTSGAITAPSLTSSGAKLSLVAPSTYDAEISGSATVGFAVKADGTNDNKSRRLLNVVDPVGNQDAATKAYADASYATTTASMSAGTGWSITGSWLRKSAKTVTLHLGASAGGGSAFSSVATSPAGWRPASSLQVPCMVGDASAGPLLYVAICVLQADGLVTVGYYNNGTSLVTPFAIGSGDTVNLEFTYVVD
jgi:hypothetical protein